MHKFSVVSPSFPQCVSCVPFVVFPCSLSRKAAPHTEWSIMTLIQHRCRAGQLPSLATSPGGPAQLLMSPPDAAQRPHKITARGNMATGTFAVIVLSLTSTFTSCWEHFGLRQWQSLADPRNLLLHFLFWLFPERTRNLSWGIAHCSPLLPLQIWKTSLDNFQQLSHMSE